jgi:hypothetical protein
MLMVFCGQADQLTQSLTSYAGLKSANTHQSLLVRSFQHDFWDDRIAVPLPSIKGFFPPSRTQAPDIELDQ